MRDILPTQQELILLVAKRKLIYRDNIMEEIKCKQKILTYFNYLKLYNPLFKDEDINNQWI